MCHPTSERNTNPVVRERAIFVDRVHLGHLGADRLTLQNGLLFPFGEQWYLVVDVFQHDEHGRFGRELLSSVVLQNENTRNQIHVHAERFETIARRVALGEVEATALRPDGSHVNGDHSWFRYLRLSFKMFPISSRLREIVKHQLAFYLSDKK